MRYSIFLAFLALCTWSCSDSGTDGPEAGPILAFENPDGSPALAFVYVDGDWEWVTPDLSHSVDSPPNAFWGEFVREHRGFRGAIGVLRFSASTGGHLWFNTSLMRGGFDASTGANVNFSAATPAEIDFDPTLGLGLGRACNLNAICDVALAECHQDGKCHANDISACYGGLYQGDIPDRFVNSVCLIADFYDCTRVGGEDSFQRCAGYLGYYGVDFDDDPDPPGRPF